MNKCRKILLGVISFCALLVVADRGLGYISERMYYKSKYGIFHRQIYCMRESCEELLILGSSRAAHHYIPSIFTDSLGYCCYNAGSDGQCIYYQYAILASYIHRNAIPKMVLCDMTPKDAEQSEGSTFSLDAALDRLAPHYGELAEVDSLFKLKGWKESVKLKSVCYRYNSKLVQSIKCNFIPSFEDKGYEALVGDFAADEAQNESGRIEMAQIDSLKLFYVSKMIDLCEANGIKLVMCYSPEYRCTPSNGIGAIKRLARQRGIPFLDNSDKKELCKRKYFKDASHLNDTGAHLYSALVAHEVRMFCTD